MLRPVPGVEQKRRLTLTPKWSSLEEWRQCLQGATRHLRFRRTAIKIIFTSSHSYVARRWTSWNAFAFRAHQRGLKVSDGSEGIRTLRQQRRQTLLRSQWGPYGAPYLRRFHQHPPSSSEAAQPARSRMAFACVSGRRAPHSPARAKSVRCRHAKTGGAPAPTRAGRPAMASTAARECVAQSPSAGATACRPATSPPASLSRSLSVL
jgi:hypothetical protein